MKKVKKLVSLVLIVVLTFLLIPFYLTVDAVSIGVKGENEEEINPNFIVDEGTLTISEVDSNDTFKAYKLLDSFYNESTNEITYKFTEDFESFLLQSENNNDLTVDEYFAKTSGDNYGQTFNSSTIDVLVSEYTTYIRSNNIGGIDMETNGNNASATVECGAYLVLPDVTYNVYAVMLGNVFYQAENGEWVLKNANIVAKKDDIKFMNFVSRLDAKYLLDNINSFNDAYSFIYSQQVTSEDSFFIGEEYTTIVGGEIYYPTNSINKKFLYEIEHAEGIKINLDYGIIIMDEYDAEYLTINDSKVYKGDIEQGSITVEDNKIILDMYNFRVNANSLWIYVAYRTKLAEDANIGTIGNKTTAKFTYATDPYSLDTTHTISVDSTVYTYGLKINNFGDEEQTSKLTGSIFEIYLDSDLSTKIGEVNIADGIGTFVGLAEGTYYVKQSKVAAGYTLFGEVLEVNIDNSSDYIEIDIINNKSWFLPSTGGIGTIIYTVIGLGIVGIASIFLVKYRKSTVNM